MAALLILLAQSEEELRRLEAERISAKKPLTESESAAYMRPAVPRPQRPLRSRSLAVVSLSFTDVASADVSELFLRDVREYYAKSSGGIFTLVGKSYGTVPLGCVREDLAKVSLRSADERARLSAAIEAWMRRDGVGVLAAHDAVAFVPGGRLGPKDSALWPHEGTLEMAEGTLRYVVVPADAGAHALGIAAHEFGHLLGLGDKYEAGPWCLMAMGYAETPPAPLCAPCRVKLGWWGAAKWDPGVERMMRMEDGDVVRLPATPDGRERLLLELRGSKMLVWHEGGGKDIELVTVLPTGISDRLTPFSAPPFLGRGAGAREVWLTDLRAENGRATFVVGPTAPLTPAEEIRRSRVGKTLGK